jgi:hypothetical protein
VRRLLVPAALAAVIAALYGPRLGHEFVIDDQVYIF